MGSCFITMTVPGGKTERELGVLYDERASQDRHEHGHDSYSGTFATCRFDGVVDDSVYPTVKAAEEYLDDAVEKRHAGAVKARDVRTVTVAEPTFGGRTLEDLGFNFGGWTSFREVAGVFTPADQLAAKDRDRLARLHGEWTKLGPDTLAAKTAFETLVKQVNDLAAPFDAWKELKAARATYAKLRAKYDGAKAALVEFDKVLKDSLFATRIVDHGEVWVIGGRAAC